MAESGATSDKEIPPKEEMENMLKTVIHLVNTKNLEELRKAMDQLPVEKCKEFLCNFKTDKNLMFHACLSKSTQIVEYFIVECKTDVNEVSKIGDETLTALFIAIKTNNIELVNLLLNHGADINWRDPENRSAIVYACYQNKMEVAHVLKNNGADINDDTNIKLCGKNLSYFKRALKLGTDVNSIDENGETILMKAVDGRDVDIISLLLKENADLYLRSHHTGRNALDNAHVFENEDVLNYFKTNSVYPLADKVISYDLCGALGILIGEASQKAVEYCRQSLRIRKKHYATLKLSAKDYPALEAAYDVASEEIAFDCLTMAECFKVALSVVCRTIDINHPFMNRLFSLVAHNPALLSATLTFDNLRDFGKMNSTSIMPLSNGVYIGLTGAVSMCEKQIGENSEDIDKTVFFIDQMVELITENFLPIVKQWPESTQVFKVYKQLLLLLLHLIDDVLEAGRSDVMLYAIIGNISRLYLFSYPTSMLLIAIERGFSFRTVLSLIAAADVNAKDYLKNTPLHLIAEQPDHFPDKGKIYQLLIDCGAQTDATNDFGIKPRISHTEM